MNCPRCKSVIAKSGRYCMKCGADFGEETCRKLVAYFGLKDEIERFGTLQADAYSSLGRISLKMQELEALLGAEFGPATVSPAQPQGRESAPVQASPGEQPAKPAPVPTEAISPFSRKEETKPSDLEVRMGQKWLLIAGILTMVFGVGYFLKYSFEQGWVTPAGRVAMAYVWSIVFLIAGDRFRKKLSGAFGLSLVGGGIAVLYFSTFAGFQIYHLLDQVPSFAIMVLITVLAGALSVYYDSKWLAVLGLVGGFLTPVLLTTGRDNQVALMTYMTILNLGLLGIAFHKKWDLLNTLGLIFTYLLYSAWYASHYADSKFWPAVLFLNVFFLIYSVAPFAYQFLRESREELKGIVLMVPNAFIAFGYSYAMIVQRSSLPWVSVVSVFYAVVFLAMASYLYKTGKQQLEAFVVLLAKALLFLIITVPLIFSKHWITVFWSAQAFALLWMGMRLERRSLRAGAYALFGMALFKFLAYDYGAVFNFNTALFAFYGPYTGTLAERAATSLVLLAALAQAGALAARLPYRTLSPEIKDSAILFGAATLLLFIVLNAETNGFFHEYLPEARFAAVSVLWTIFSVCLMIAGFRANSALVRKASFGLFLITVLKVFLSDMANVSTPYRIISFIILGLVLVGTSYLYYKYKDRVISVMADAGDKERTS